MRCSSVDEFLLPIDQESVETAPADAGIVGRILEQAQAAPAVTDAHLSAQDYSSGPSRGRTTCRGQDRGPHGGDPSGSGGRHRVLQPGHARTGMADLEGAIADYGEAIRLEPRNAAAYTSRGEFEPVPSP
jgi:hypothetical protein